ncbi:MAG TPA: glycosyltransferase [Candidatus Angelobacter sp.]|nr:glycosyltransferase [Candidatus Angelobacter sp.]
MLLAAGILSLLIWGYLLLLRGGFWRIQIEDTAPQFAPVRHTNESPVRVAAIVPARNEADVIGRAVSSLLRQEGPNSVHIFLVDDGSTDGTATAAREAAELAGRTEMLTIIEGQPLAPGWAGKLWAMHQGIKQARATAPDFFLFTDADIEHAPGSVFALVRIAQSGPYDLASFMVRLYCETFAEKLLVPAFVFFFFKLYPPAWTANPRRSAAGAAGGCILIRPAALAKAGGIEAIRQEIIDDCALATRVKGSGGRLWLGASAATRSLRPYGGFAEIGRMISRSAFNQLRHSIVALALSVAGMSITYLLPPALVLFSHGRWPASLGAASWLMMTLSYLPVLRLYRLSPLWALALPLVAVFYMGATFNSAWKYWTRRGGEWKGRVQDPLES